MSYLQVQLSQMRQNAKESVKDFSIRIEKTAHELMNALTVGRDSPDSEIIAQTVRAHSLSVFIAVDDNSTLTNENILNETALQQEQAVYTNLSEINDTKEYDIGFAVEKDSNVKIRKEISQLYNYLCKTWTPNKKYVFPVTKDKNGHSRSFRIEWINKYNWLAYSHLSKGAFCKVCVLFGPKVGGIGGQRLGILKETPLIKYKDALYDLKKHAEREYHKTAILRSFEFIKCFEGKQQTVEVQLNDQIDACDENLRKHFESASKNATFVSKTVQNELINICGSIITDKLIKEIKDSVFYSILCEETSDLTHIEQMSLSVRYVDTTTCTIKENYICFVPVFECTGENLANIIIQKLKELGSSLEFLRGQGYDGGANMSGKYKGVQARILNLQPKASYTHCASHRLNLTLLKACNVLPIKKSFSIVKEVCNFVRDSPKRVDLFKKVITEHLPTSKSVILIKL
ncbi:zinc finger MYM-type protein 1-like [Aphis gossypii]|uniref:zinc finger MYM-type protein 1-like n=1 Tax=Aphis gossypii TaxID=80765 RepID=UPI002159A4F1|nr:zinc finger MYM-type protein 1-like [Aphis gossypii]